MMHLYWVALKSIWAKEIHRFMRIWVQTLVPPVITMTLYFIIFGNLIGSRIGDMHGFSYMQFIVPGLIMMSVITNAYANVASSFFGAKFQRNIEELLVAPVPTAKKRTSAAKSILNNSIYGENATNVRVCYLAG